MIQVKIELDERETCRVIAAFSGNLYKEDVDAVKNMLLSRIGGAIDDEKDSREQRNRAVKLLNKLGMTAWIDEVDRVVALYRLEEK